MVIQYGTICGISIPKIAIVSMPEMISCKIIQNVFKFIETVCNYVENSRINDLNEMNLSYQLDSRLPFCSDLAPAQPFLTLSRAIFSRSIKVKWMGNWNSKSEWNKLWSISLMQFVCIVRSILLLLIACCVSIEIICSLQPKAHELLRYITYICILLCLSLFCWAFQFPFVFHSICSLSLAHAEQIKHLLVSYWMVLNVLISGCLSIRIRRERYCNGENDFNIETNRFFTTLIP